MTKLALRPQVLTASPSEPRTQAIEVRTYHTPEAIAAQHRPASGGEVPACERPRPLQRSALVHLMAEGVLPAWSVRAGQEIGRVYAAITASVAPRVSANYGERLDKSPDEDLPEALRIACVSRYTPWRQWSGQQAVTPARALSELTLLVCVDGLGPRQAADALRMDQRTVKRRLQASLHWYARHAGWLHAREA